MYNDNNNTQNSKYPDLGGNFSLYGQNQVKDPHANEKVDLSKANGLRDIYPELNSPNGEQVKKANPYASDIKPKEVNVKIIFFYCFFSFF